MTSWKESRRAGNPDMLAGDRKAQVVAVVVLAAAVVDAALGLVVWAMLHCLFGGE